MKKLLLLSAVLLSACATRTVPESTPTINYSQWNRAMRQPLHSGLKFTSAKEIDAWVNANVKYQDEKVDYWQSPQETLLLHHGDCEDFAILKYALMKENGIFGARPLLLIDRNRENVPHMVLLYDGRYLDNQEDKGTDYQDWYLPLAFVRDR